MPEPHLGDCINYFCDAYGSGSILRTKQIFIHLATLSFYKKVVWKPLAKDRESPPCLAYKTVREIFTSHGSSMIWLLSLAPLTSLSSLASFVSWQCRCSNWRLSLVFFPPFFRGVLWSISSKFPSLKNNPQWAHIPFCFFKSEDTLNATSGCIPILVLQYIQSPS